MDRKRTPKACDCCRLRKIKCDGAEGECCSSCLRNNLTCTYSHVSRRGRPKLTEPDLKKPDTNLLLDRIAFLEAQLQSKGKWDPFSCEKQAIITSAERFFANSNYSIFSLVSSQWITKQVGHAEYLEPLNKLHALTKERAKMEMGKWVNPIERAQLYPFPSSTFISQLIVTLYRCNRPILLLHDEPELERLFSNYAKEPSTTSYSELLIMNTVLAISVSGASDTTDHPQDLSGIAERYLLNALYYYHHISLVGDGIKGLEGVMLLAWYVETRVFTQASSLLLATAIRFSQELGLHSRESYRDLPPVECEKRKLLFWFCYAFDRNSAFKSGKPFLWNDDDITVDPPAEFASVWRKSDQVFGGTNRISSVKSMIELCFSTDLLDFVRFFILEMSTVVVPRARAFLKCFKKLTFEEIIVSLEALNRGFANWYSLIPQKLKPDAEGVFHLELADSTTEERVRMRLTSLHFEFFHLVSTINRIVLSAFLINGTHEKLEHFAPLSYGILKKCHDYGSDCSRTILRIFQHINKKKSSYINWFGSYPFSAFAHIFRISLKLCESPEVVEDVKLLTKICMELSSSNTDTCLFLHMCTKILLYIVVNYVEAQNSQISFGLHDYLKDVAEKLDESPQNANSMVYVSPPVPEDFYHPASLMLDLSGVDTMECMNTPLNPLADDDVALGFIEF